MSLDETDSEQTSLQPKVVRRIPKPWVNSAISEMWNAVERYGKGRINRIGNAPYSRIFEPNPSSRTQQNMPAQRRLCVPGLPSNYYSELWWRSLSPAQWAQVDRKSSRELPSYVSHTGLFIGGRVTNDAQGTYIGLIVEIHTPAHRPFSHALPSSTSHSYAPCPPCPPSILLCNPMPMPLLAHAVTYARLSIHLLIEPMKCYAVHLYCLGCYTMRFIMIYFGLSNAGHFSNNCKQNPRWPNLLRSD